MRFWYHDNDANACTESDPLTNRTTIHGNVEVIGTTAKEGTDLADNLNTKPADDEYVFDIKTTIVGNKLANMVTMDENYKDVGLKEGGKVTLQFVSGTVNKGTEVQKLYPNWAADGKSIDGSKLHTVDWTDKTKANPQTDANVVAEMNKETGIVKFADNDVAKELLNRWGHKDLQQTVTAIVGVKADFCLPDMTISDANFNVKFLRPVDVSEGKADFEDAETKGSIRPVSFELVDWRNHNFTSKADAKLRKGENYFAYYGHSLDSKIIEISVDVTKAETNINGNRKLLYLVDKDGNPTDDVNKAVNGITNDLRFIYYKPGTDKSTIDGTNGSGSGFFPIKVTGDVTAEDKDIAVDYGYLYYANAGVTVDDFTVWFPAVVKYDWGTITCWVKSEIGRTHDNARRR
jgi:hypothetical protein